MSKLIVELNDDGTVKLNAREMIGAEDELLELLGELAAEVGGELVVEAHVEGAHHHHHGHGGGHHHHHGGGGHRH
jgi:hypothetical protein